MCLGQQLAIFALGKRAAGRLVRGSRRRRRASAGSGAARRGLFARGSAHGAPDGSAAARDPRATGLWRGVFCRVLFLNVLLFANSALRASPRQVRNSGARDTCRAQPSPARSRRLRSPARAGRCPPAAPRLSTAAPEHMAVAQTGSALPLGGSRRARAASAPEGAAPRPGPGCRCPGGWGRQLLRFASLGCMSCVPVCVGRGKGGIWAPVAAHPLRRGDVGQVEGSPPPGRRDEERDAPSFPPLESTRGAEEWGGNPRRARRSTPKP